MISDDGWKQEAIERDMMATMKKLGKGENIIIFQFYNLKRCPPPLGDGQLQKYDIVQ